MLHRARKEAVLVEAIAPAVAVLCLNPHALTTSDLSDVARDGEATLEVSLVTVVAHDARVDELIGLPSRFNDGHVERLAKLRGGKASARCRAHRVREVIEQLVQHLAERADRLPRHAEAWITKEQDWLNAHGAILASARGASRGQGRW